MAHTFAQQQTRARLIVTALRGAKEFIRRPGGNKTKTEFVCCAVSAWYQSQGHQYWCNNAGTVRAYISRAINHRSTFDSWLFANGHKRLSGKRLQELRHAWVDQMIADLTKTYKL